MPDGQFLLVESSSGMMWESCVPFNNTGMKTIIVLKNISTFKFVLIHIFFNVCVIRAYLFKKGLGRFDFITCYDYQLEIRLL